MSSALTLNAANAPDMLSTLMALPISSPAAATRWPTSSRFSPVRPSLVLRSWTMFPASPKDIGTVVAMPLALSSSASSASPDAPVPMMMASVISSNSPPMSSRNLPTSMPANAAPMTPAILPSEPCSVDMSPPPSASPPCWPAAVRSGTSASVMFCLTPCAEGMICT